MDCEYDEVCNGPTSHGKTPSPEWDSKKFRDDLCPTATSYEQIEVEDMVEACFNEMRKKINGEPPALIAILLKDRHLSYLENGLVTLPKSFQCLDCSRPWLCYWIVHALNLLDSSALDEMEPDVITFLERCQHPDGGFGGGPNQIAHLAPTYAAVNSLCTFRRVEAYNTINREKLLQFLLKMKRPDGSFAMHEGGEVDIRGVYCALSVAYLTNIVVPELLEGVAEWIVRCQSYEGGFGGVPNMEAHGGYTFCGFASLVLMRKENMCNIRNLVRWLVNRQMKFEGGFQGRTNKLVDSCYSFWQGALFPLIHRFLSSAGGPTLRSDKWLFNQQALQEYLLLCCQYVTGGLIDKPEKYMKSIHHQSSYRKSSLEDNPFVRVVLQTTFRLFSENHKMKSQPRDYYHTCYALSGLSIAQHFAGGNIASNFIFGRDGNELGFLLFHQVCLKEETWNHLIWKQTHPVYNIVVSSAVKATRYFRNQKVPVISSHHRQKRKVPPEN